MTATTEGKSKRTPKATDETEGKKRPRRTPEQVVADLEAQIEKVKARAAVKEAKQRPEGKALIAALKGLDKAGAAAEAAGNAGLVRALEAARAPLAEQLVAMGLRMPAGQ